LEYFPIDTEGGREEEKGHSHQFIKFLKKINFFLKIGGLISALRGLSPLCHLQKSAYADIDD